MWVGITQSVSRVQAVSRGAVKVGLIESGEKETASFEIRVAVVAELVSCARQIHCAVEGSVSILTWVGLQSLAERCLKSVGSRLKLGVWLLQQKQWGLASCYSQGEEAQVQVQDLALALAQVQSLSLHLLSCLLLLLLLLKVRVQILLQI